jgi:hypothetical protein
MPSPGEEAVNREKEKPPPPLLTPLPAYNGGG